METAEVLAGLPAVKSAPSDGGLLEMIVMRPAVDQREVVDEGVLDLTVGLVGDNWLAKGSSSTPDGKANPEAQLTVMNARAIALVAGSRDRWSLAGDQLYVDLDISQENLPAGTRLRIGEVLIEVSSKPHTGCEKFRARFGREALRVFNSAEGRKLRLRGLNAKVIEPGTIRVGDRVSKEPAEVLAV